MAARDALRNTDLVELGSEVLKFVELVNPVIVVARRGGTE